MPSSESSIFPIFIYDDLLKSLRILAEAENTTVTDYARGKLYDLAKPAPKEFEPLFRTFCDEAKRFAKACSELPSVPVEQRKEIEAHLTMTLLAGIIPCKPQMLAVLGLIEQLH